MDVSVSKLSTYIWLVHFSKTYQQTERDRHQHSTDKTTANTCSVQTIGKTTLETTQDRDAFRPGH